MRTNIRIGDLVKVINPLVFIRCGYPYSLEYARNTLLSSKDRQDIEKIIGAGDIPFKIREKIEDGFALVRLHQAKYGGRERSLHFETRQDLIDCMGVVTGRKVYVAGYYSTDTDYEDSCSIAYLKNQKHHIVFEVRLEKPFEKFNSFYNDSTFRFESTCLEKL